MCARACSAAEPAKNPTTSGATAERKKHTRTFPQSQRFDGGGGGVGGDGGTVGVVVSSCKVQRTKHRAAVRLQGDGELIALGFSKYIYL